MVACTQVSAVGVGGLLPRLGSLVSWHAPCLRRFERECSQKLERLHVQKNYLKARNCCARLVTEGCSVCVRLAACERC